MAHEETWTAGCAGTGGDFMPDYATSAGKTAKNKGKKTQLAPPQPEAASQLKTRGSSACACAFASHPCEEKTRKRGRHAVGLFKDESGPVVAVCL